MQSQKEDSQVLKENSFDKWAKAENELKNQSKETAATGLVVPKSKDDAREVDFVC